MKKSNLKNQMIVECRNGKRRMVVDNILICDNGFIDLLNYNNDLKHMKFSEFDIIKIYDKIYRLDLLDNQKRLNLLWARSEVKEVTMADVEKKFGCKIKIVKEEE